MRARSMHTPIPGAAHDRTLHELRNTDKPRASHTPDAPPCDEPSLRPSSAHDSCTSFNASLRGLVRPGPDPPDGYRRAGPVAAVLAACGAAGPAQPAGPA